MNDLNKIVKAALKSYGDNAAAHFGIKEGTLKSYIKRGKYPLSLIEKILADTGQIEMGPAMQGQPVGVEREPEPQLSTAAVINKIVNPDPDLASVNTRVQDVIQYLQSTVDFYIKQFASRIGLLERTVAALSAQQLRLAGMASQTRPAAGVPVDQVFTTNPTVGIGNALDTGVAPTKEQVEAQANMTIIEGVPVPNAQLAHPAEYDPNAPAFGYGWNQPRPPRK
jgi:hypothetical protein